jgi:DNA polymerase theta
LAGHSVLIFCHTKAKCEAVAEQIAKEFFDIGSMANTTCPEFGKKIRDQLDSNKIREVLTQLEQCPGGLEEVLKKTVSFGVAFHHAGKQRVTRPCQEFQRMTIIYFHFRSDLRRTRHY